MQTISKNRTFAYSIVLLSLSIIIGYIEVIFPFSIGDVGIKLGLGNLVTLLGLKTIGGKLTFLINALRLIILGVLFGNVVRFSLSVGGFLLSFVVMYALLINLNFGLKTASIFGGVSHNIGQFIVLIFVIKNNKILYLLPIYILIGIVTGFVVGVISDIIYTKILKLKIV